MGTTKQNVNRLVRAQVCTGGCRVTEGRSRFLFALGQFEQVFVRARFDGYMKW